MQEVHQTLLAVFGLSEQLWDVNATHKVWIKDTVGHALSGQDVKTRLDGCELCDRTDRQQTDGQTCSSSIRLCNTPRLLLLNWWKPWEGMAWANGRTGQDKKKKKKEGGDKQKVNGQNPEKVQLNTKDTGQTLRCRQWNSTGKCKYRFITFCLSFNFSMEKLGTTVEYCLTSHGGGVSCLTCGGSWPPFFTQVSFGVGEPDALQYNLNVSPSWISAFWGLTWTWGTVPRPLGFDSKSRKKAMRPFITTITPVDRVCQIL